MSEKRTTINLPFSPKDVAAGRISPASIKCPHCDGTGFLSTEHTHVGELIYATRKARGLTQDELSKEVRLSRSQVANIETGRSDIPMKVLRLFAEALGVSMKDLVP